MVNTRWNHVKCFICKEKLCNENRLKVHYPQYHPISMDEALLPNEILPPAGTDHPEPSWFDYSSCTWVAIDMLSINDLLIDHVPGAPPPEHPPNGEPIDPQQPDLTCTPDPTKTKTQRQAIGVTNAGGKAYGEATRFYNKHRKNSEQWNPWHPFRSADDFHQAQCCSHQTTTWIDHHFRHGLDDFKIERFQSAGTLRKLLSELDFGLGDDSWIEDDSHMFRTLYSRDIFKSIQFLLAHLQFQKHHGFELVRLAASEDRRIHSQMITGDCWWDTQDRLPAGATIVPVICASDKTHLTNFSRDQHAWLLYLTIGNIPKGICRTANTRTWILVWLIPCPPKGAKNIDEVSHSAVRTALSQLCHLELTDPGLKWDCADGFQRHFYHLLPAWVGDNPEQVMVPQGSYGSCPMCEIPNGEPMGYSTFQPLDHSRDHHIFSELLEDNHLDALHTPGVHPIRNQFWHYPAWNVYRL